MQHNVMHFANIGSNDAMTIHQSTQKQSWWAALANYSISHISSITFSMKDYYVTKNDDAWVISSYEDVDMDQSLFIHTQAEWNSTFIWNDINNHVIDLFITINMIIFF